MIAPDSPNLPQYSESHLRLAVKSHPQDGGNSSNVPTRREGLYVNNNVSIFVECGMVLVSSV